MNLITETKNKLSWYETNLEDLKKCLDKDFLTKDGIRHVKEEIKKVESNIEYYKGILKVLEERK